MTKFGKPVLLLGGYRFNLNNRTTGSKRRWTCSRNGARVCKAYVITIDSKIVMLNNVHTHAHSRRIHPAASVCMPPIAHAHMFRQSFCLSDQLSATDLTYRPPLAHSSLISAQSIYLPNQPLAGSVSIMPSRSHANLFSA